MNDSMKEKLVEKIRHWSKEKADAFHKNKFINVGEDGNYLWERSDRGIFLWKDTNAIFFDYKGLVYKLSVWSFRDYWKCHESLYKEINRSNTCRIEEPIYYEYVQDLDMGYSVVKRPGNQIGNGFLELFMMNRIDESTVLRSIDEFYELFLHIKNLHKIYNCPYPFVPKQFEDSQGRFWGDFKYWKYSEQEFRTNYIDSMNRFLPVLNNDRDISLNTNFIMDKLYDIWKM
jgi:hypothetical protein